MMLLKIKDYLAANESATLMEIAKHVGTEPLTVKPMLAHWIRKGMVSKVPQPQGCGSRCTKCDPSFAEIYQWV